MTTPLDELAEQIGAAVLDAIEQNRRINKADLVDAAHTVLRRRRALLGMEPQAVAPKPARLPRVMRRDGSVLVDTAAMGMRVGDILRLPDGEHGIVVEVAP